MTQEESGGSWENRSSLCVPPTAAPEVSLALQLRALGGNHGLGHRRMTIEPTIGSSYLSVRPFPSPDEPDWPQTGLRLFSSSWLFYRGKTQGPSSLPWALPFPGSGVTYFQAGPHCCWYGWTVPCLGSTRTALSPPGAV